MPMKVYVSYLVEDEAGRSAGARVVEPPPDTHQAQRGHFYAVADLRDETVDTKILTERLLSAMQRTYYSFKGTQSQVMQATIQQAKQFLLAEFGRSGTQPRMGVICIGLLNDRLAMAGLGDAFAFVTTDTGGVNVYPPDRLDPAAQPAPATPELWPLHRQKIGADTVILAATGRWLEKVSARTLAGTTAYVDAANCQDAVAWLREQANQTDLPGLLLVLDQGPAAPPPPPSTGGGQPLTPRGSGLPTAVGATPPVTDVPPADTGLEVTDSAPIAAQPAPSDADLAADAVEQGVRSQRPGWHLLLWIPAPTDRAFLLRLLPAPRLVWSVLVSCWAACCRTATRPIYRTAASSPRALRSQWRW